jgi:hypothetical protein
MIASWMWPSSFPSALPGSTFYTLTLKTYINLRAMKTGYIIREQIDDCDPNIIIALPRLAIVWYNIRFSNKLFLKLEIV